MNRPNIGYVTAGGCRTSTANGSMAFFASSDEWMCIISSTNSDV